MANGRDDPPRRGKSAVLIASYVVDWLVLAAAGVIGAVVGNTAPNKRPFSLTDPDISFPYDLHETVSSVDLFTANAIIPTVVIFLVTMFLVPGSTVPKGMPKSLIWRRKLWELHVGLLGLALSLVSAWFFTNGMKNLAGKPRPDLLSRCQPDLENLAKYVVGGIAGPVDSGQLVSADICQNPDASLLNDGFRSFPSGHSSSSAGGLIYLSLYLASKFAVTFPFLAQAGLSPDAASASAFPSRTGSYEAVRPGSSHAADSVVESPEHEARRKISAHQKTVLSARRQAAAAPIYLLVITVLPFLTAIFIAISRWYNFRHHGFDILFGFGMGTVTAFFSFRYYHLPLTRGAGWSWGPRSSDKAFWAGVGSYSYATGKSRLPSGCEDEEAVNVSGSDRAVATPRATHAAEHRSGEHQSNGSEQLSEVKP